VLGLLAVLNLPSHARFSDTAFYAQGGFQFTEREYRYTDVTAVDMARYYRPANTYLRHDRPSRDRWVFLTLRDGTLWTPVYSLLSLRDNLSSSIAQEVSQRSGLPIHYPDEVFGAPTLAQQQARNLWGLLLSSLIFLAPFGVTRYLTRRQKASTSLASARK
jgi:hypothetical protein